MANKNIESILTEHRLFPPSASFAAAARLNAAELDALYAQADVDYVGYWAERARDELLWTTPFTQTLETQS